MADERPVHLEIHCPTGARIETPLTDEELAAHDQSILDNQARCEREQAQAEQLRAAAAAHSDPLVRALAARAGLA